MTLDQQLKRETSLLTGRLSRLGETLARGAGLLKATARKALSLLSVAHTEAAKLGRNKAGDLAPVSAQDSEIGGKNALRQARFYQGFAEDAKVGRYAEKADGGEGKTALRRRSLMYGLALAGTANEAWATTKATLEDDPLARWVTAECEHCPDCTEEAAKGLRPLSTFDRYPGDGSTACKTRCRCRIETEDGDRGFSNAY